ncbi:pseudouridine synthase [Shewanella gaetbuli]
MPDTTITQKPSHSTAAIAAQPSYVVLPQQSQNSRPYTTVLDFLVARFSQIPQTVWLQRMAQGKVHWLNGELITATTAYRQTQKVCYYREVEQETKVPFTEQILHQDPDKIIVYKPHFLPVTPGGNYVNECLVHRLRIRTGIDTIAPAHRLDKDTAGIMLMTVNPETRHAYHQLFLDGKIKKTYQAIANVPPDINLNPDSHWTVKNRLVRGTPSFLMQIVEGQANSHSEIRLLDVKNEVALFELEPVTGKTHQLRVHMHSLGFPLLNDRFYPKLLARTEENFAKPLKLLAQRLQFVDPITQQVNDWQCDEFKL